MDRYRAAQEPMVAVTLARETHVNDPMPFEGLKIQVSVSYSDGFGREIQKKLQAEPGPLVENGPIISPRWVASGWALFNNKGKPVKQYEPFFDDTHQPWLNHAVGVSSRVFYDPLERVVATLHPNHTWEKVVFDSWRQENWDVNDTALLNPRSDPSVGQLFEPLSESDYLPSWHAQRQAGALGSNEQAAALKTAVHAGTPSILHADSLGRSFLTIAHNRFERSGEFVEEEYFTRVVIDIEGNEREVLDAKDRAVIRYDYNLVGLRIHRASMEAGEKWMLSDTAGLPLYTWDSRGHRFRTTYDPLRRPMATFLQKGAAAELLVSRTMYGEGQSNPEAKNQRGRVV